MRRFAGSRHVLLPVCTTSSTFLVSLCLILSDSSPPVLANVKIIYMIKILCLKFFSRFKSYYWDTETDAKIDW
jgi:hypothetical protein